MLGFDTITSVNHCDEQLVMLVRRLSHVCDLLAHRGLSGLVLLGFFKSIISVQGIKQIVHLLVEGTSSICLSLWSDCNSITVYFKTLDLLQISVGVGLHVLVRLDKSALDHDTTLFAGILNRIIQQNTNNLTQTSSIMIHHEDWHSLEPREANVFRSDSNAVLSGFILGHGKDFIYFSLEREWF